MPGETALPVSEYPDEFGVINRGFNPIGSPQVPLGIFDRDIIIDGWKVRYEVAEGAALTGNLAKAADGVALGTNTNLSGTVDFNTTPATAYSSAITATVNLLKAGEVLMLEFSAAPGTLSGVSVTVRYRTRKR